MVATHCFISGNGVFNDTWGYMPIMGQVVGKRRTIIKLKVLFPLARFHTFAKKVFFLPYLQQTLFEFGRSWFLIFWTSQLVYLFRFRTPYCQKLGMVPPDFPTHFFTKQLGSQLIHLSWNQTASSKFLFRSSSSLCCLSLAIFVVVITTHCCLAQSQINVNDHNYSVNGWKSKLLQDYK